MSEEQLRARLRQGKHDFAAVRRERDEQRGRIEQLERELRKAAAERDAARVEYRNLLKAGDDQDDAFEECIEQRAKLFESNVDLHQRIEQLEEALERVIVAMNDESRKPDELIVDAQIELSRVQAVLRAEGASLADVPPSEGGS